MRPVTCNSDSTADRISAVQYVRFPLPASARAALADEATALVLEIDHPNYPHRVTCAPGLRASLARDYAELGAA